MYSFQFLAGAVVAFAATHASAAASIDDFDLDCTGSFVIEQTSETFYNPWSCPNGLDPFSRFGCGRPYPTPPSAGFKAIIALTPDGEGCKQVTSKYSLPIEGKIAATVYLRFPVALSNTVTAAALAVGSKGEFKVIQRFPYAKADGTLPLYPLLHSEEIGLSGTFDIPAVGKASFGTNENVNVQAVYGIPAPHDLDAPSTIAAALKLKQLVTSGDGHVYDIEPFAYLFSGLNAFQAGVSKELLKIFVSLLEHEAMQPYHGASFFDFKVGGSSGTFIALQINALTHVPGTLTEDELIALLAKYPGLLTVMGSEGCPAVNANIASNLLTKLLDEVVAGDLPSVTASAYTLRAIATELNGTAAGFCTSDLRTPAVVAKASALKEAL